MMMQAQSVYWQEDTAEEVKHEFFFFQNNTFHGIIISESITISTFSNVGNLSVPIFLEELDCRPTDSDILQCNTFSTLGIHSCSHSEDVSVRCTGTYVFKI